MARTKSAPQRRDRRRMIHKDFVAGRKQSLRVTSKKGAYNKARKKNFMVRRSPFIETKNQTDLIVSLKAGNATGTPQDTLRMTTEPLKIDYQRVIPGSSPPAYEPKELTILPLNSFMNMNQGFDSSDMIGNTVFSKYLKCKIEFQLPYGSNQIRHPCDMYLVHGFVTQPIGNTLHTLPEALDFTRANYTEHIEEQLLQYFNQRRDKLEFIPKATSNIKFLGYKKLKVKRSSNLGPDPNAMSDGNNVFQYGSHPLVNMTVDFPMMRKVHYEQGTAGTTTTPLPFYYPNYSWLPFVALYNPTAHEFLSTVTYPGPSAGSNDPPEMYVRYNSIHYFSDS